MTTQAHAPVFARQYAQFYDQLGRQLKAGLAAHVTIGNVLSGPIPAALRAVLEDARGRVEAGEGLADVLAKHPRVIPKHEARFLQAAEAAGRLPAACEKLSLAHNRTHKRTIRFASKIVYPVSLLLVASFVAPFKLLFDGETGRYLVTAGTPALALVGALVGSAWVAFAPDGAPYRKSLYTAAMGFPPLAAALRQLSLARAGTLMAMCFESGLPADQVFKLVAESTPDPVLRKACLAVGLATGRGKSIAGAMESHGKAFPGVMTSVVRTGEESGRLDDALAKAAEFWQEDADRAVDSLVTIAVGGLMGLGMLIVAFLILSIGLGLTHQLQTLI